MAEVTLTPEAQRQFGELPLPIKGRIARILNRLNDWPAVSGAKPMRGELSGNFRIRTGDFRVIFTVTRDNRLVTVWKMGNRRDFYDDE